MGEFNKKENAGAPILFVAPENFNQSFTITDDTLVSDLKNASDWDIALRYHEFKSNPNFKEIVRNLRKISALSVLRQAQAILGSVVKPKYVQSVPVVHAADLSEYELDLDETIEHAPWFGDPDKAVELADLWIEKTFQRTQPLIITVDTSLSMTGEKLALTAVALAVVLLEFPDDPIGIIAFESEAKVIKYPSEKLTVFELVERFLDVPSQGYTHLEDGIKKSLKLLLKIKAEAGMGARPASVVLLTDGKYTAGRDPAYLAKEMNHLVVLKMGRDRSSLALCQEMAKLGHGVMKEVGNLESLPKVMYGVIKDLLRGRALR